MKRIDLNYFSVQQRKLFPNPFVRSVRFCPKRVQHHEFSKQTSEHTRSWNEIINYCLSVLSQDFMPLLPIDDYVKCTQYLELWNILITKIYRVRYLISLLCLKCKTYVGVGLSVRLLRIQMQQPVFWLPDCSLTEVV